MAIFHFSAKILKRSENKNSVRAAAYRSGSVLTDERTGYEFDYSHKKGIGFSFILAPKTAPEWVQDRGRLWSEVEKIEKRKDAQLARDFDVALPVELTNEQKVKLIAGFVQSQFVDHGMIADVNLHDLNSKNPHAHFMLTMRDITPTGFGKKNRAWNEYDLMEKWRSAWADSCNKALAQAGLHRMKIDHRSYVRQGVDKKPTVHVGPVASKQEKAGIETPQGNYNRQIKSFNDLKLEIKIQEEREKDQEEIMALIRVDFPDFQGVVATPKPTPTPTPKPTINPAVLQAKAVELNQVIRECRSRIEQIDDPFFNWVLVPKFEPQKQKTIEKLERSFELSQQKQKAVDDFKAMPFYRRAWESIRGRVPPMPKNPPHVYEKQIEVIKAGEFARLKEQNRIALAVAKKELKALIEANPQAFKEKSEEPKLPPIQPTVAIENQPGRAAPGQFSTPLVEPDLPPPTFDDDKDEPESPGMRF